VLPGTKATVADLEWLRSRGLDGALAERARQDLPTLGICGGYQMLGERIRDTVESGEGEVQALGLLPIETVFEEEKILARPEGRAADFEDASVSGYEIRHGRVVRLGAEPLFAVDDPANSTRDGGTEGCRTGSTFGTSWHGVFESDGFRRAFLLWVAAERGLDWVAGDESFAGHREAQLDRLGDLVAENVDREALLRLVEDGPPEGLPLISSGMANDRRTTGMLAARGAGDE
jgi:adenosylcobyric acid synthase